MNNGITIVVPTLMVYQDGVMYFKSYFKQKKYDLIIIDNSIKNLGFAPAVNKGAKNVKSKWMLILNDDIEFKYENNKIKGESETLKKLMKYADDNKLDTVTPLLLNPGDQPENFAYKIFPNGSIKKGDYKNNDFDGITAACLLIKTEVFKKLGGFDESFFVSLEDVDFFFRFKNAGYKMGVAENIKVFHNHMTTTKTMGNFKAKQDMINWWRLYFKHPDKFKFDLDFIIERLRNVSGFVKASFKIINNK